MGFWNAFKEEYRTERKREKPREPNPEIRERPYNHGSEQRHAQIEDLLAENQSLAAQLGQSEEHLAEGKQLIRELAAEVQTLTNELSVRRRAEPRTAGLEKFNLLRRFVVKHVHPDIAGDDKRLRAALNGICKEVDAEADRIAAA